MPLPRRRILIVTAAAAAVVSIAPLVSRAADPAPAKDPAALQQQMMTDKAAFAAAFTSPAVLTDPDARKAAAPRLIPAGQKLYADLEAMTSAKPELAPQLKGAAGQMTTVLATLGDAEATARLQKQAGSADAEEAVGAKANQLLVRWWQTSKDPAAQAKVADDLTTLAKAHPDSIPLTGTAMTMAQMGPANSDLAGRARTVVAEVLKNPMADQVKGQIAGEQKMAKLVGQPMTIAGQTVDGKPFTTADWKGKVVLVDFWATWCPPCRAELPTVEAFYAKYHGKGLEMVGVSNDQTADALKSFMKDDAKLAWTQLFDPAAAATGGWNPITTGYGINGIPTMFLIDKQGVCRAIDARATYEEMVPKLLGEK